MTKKLLGIDLGGTTIKLRKEAIEAPRKKNNKMSILVYSKNN